MSVCRRQDVCLHILHHILSSGRRNATYLTLTPTHPPQVTDSVTSNGLAEFITKLGGKHFR